MVASKSPKTVANNVLMVGNWLKDARIETLPPSSVTARHIAHWINDPTRGWKRSYRHVLLGSVRTFFEFCSAQGWIVADPSSLVALDYSCMTHEQKKSPEKMPFTEEEVKHLIQELTGALERIARKAELKAVDERTDEQESELEWIQKQKLFQQSRYVLFWLFAVRLAAETGLRLSDIAALEWRSLARMEAGKLILWMEKTNQRIEHTISPALQNFIGDIPVVDADYVFPEQRSVIKDPAKRAGLSVQFARLCERVGIKDRSFHRLRHFKASHDFAKMDKEALAAKLAQALSMEQIAALLGHASSKTS